MVESLSKQELKNFLAKKYTKGGGVERENADPNQYGKGGSVKKKGFMVFNYTDDIYASNDTFPTKAKANQFITQFRKRFEGQGYYRDNRMNKVAIKDIDLLAIPENFNPFK